MILLNILEFDRYKIALGCKKAYMIRKRVSIFLQIKADNSHTQILHARMSIEEIQSILGQAKMYWTEEYFEGGLEATLSYQISDLNVVFNLYDGDDAPREVEVSLSK